MEEKNWRIKLINIGEKHVTEDIDVYAETLPIAERMAIRYACLHLARRDVTFVDNNSLAYLVLAGIQPVGQVKIISL